MKGKKRIFLLATLILLFGFSLAVAAPTVYLGDPTTGTDLELEIVNGVSYTFEAYINLPAVDAPNGLFSSAIDVNYNPSIFT